MAQAAGDEIMISIDPHLRTEGIPDEFLFNIHDLIKRFDIGDSVAVSHGKEVGCSGIVVSTGDFRSAFLRCARTNTLMPRTDSATRMLTIQNGARFFQSRMEDCCNPAGEFELKMMVVVVVVVVVAVVVVMMMISYLYVRNF